MPIRPENVARYPKDWPTISRTIRANAYNQCEWCGVRNYALGAWIEGHWHTAEPKGSGERDWPRQGERFPCRYRDHVEWAKVTRIVLTVAHLDHVPEHCEADNLRALCQRCHNAYDMPMRRAGIAKRAREALGVIDMFENDG
jgi:hypothetical protein